MIFLGIYNKFQENLKISESIRAFLKKYPDLKLADNNQTNLPLHVDVLIGSLLILIL